MHMKTTFLSPFYLKNTVSTLISKEDLLIYLKKKAKLYGTQAVLPIHVYVQYVHTKMKMTTPWTLSSNTGFIITKRYPHRFTHRLMQSDFPLFFLAPSWQIIQNLFKI